MWRATLLVARKEILGSFRDRQSTLYMVVLPIVLYPFLFWCLIQGSLFLQGKREHTEVTLGVASAGGALPEGLTEALSRDVDAPQPTGPEDARTASAARRPGRRPMMVGPIRDPLDEAGARAWLKEGGGPAASTAPEHPDAVLFLPRRPAEPPAIYADGDALFDSSTDGPRAERPSTRGGAAPSSGTRTSGAQVFYDSTQARSELARSNTERRMEHFAESLRGQSAISAGHSPRALDGVTIDAPENIAPDKDVRAYLLSILLPMLLVVMTVMGAFFPAVDLTAGERERNTCETTLLLPVPSQAVHQGKILAVCAGAMLATALNLLALALSAGHLINLLQAGTNVDLHVPVQAFLSILPLALLFAFFVSAVLTGVASLARTFREGQALLGPVQLVFILPALAGAIPGLELTPALSFVPVLNVVLAFRGLLKGDSLPLPYTLTALSLLAYATIAIWAALRWLSRETLFSSTRVWWFSEFAQLWRRARDRG
jgi:ABC-type Na+ efflux pump permease subunit